MVSKCKGNQKELFKVVSVLLDTRKSSPLPSMYGSLSSVDTLQSIANKFNSFFINKVVNIRKSLQATTSANPSTHVYTYQKFLSLPSDFNDPSCLSSFETCSNAALLSIIKSYGIVTSTVDPLPSTILSVSIDVLIPYFCFLVNLSLSSGTMAGLKEACIRPLLKQNSLDPDILSNYRPISQLPFLSKLIERVVLTQLNSHISKNNLWNHSQFAYKKYHSTESLLLKLINDISTNIDHGLCTLVVAIDLSAAFDTVDHHKLLEILCSSFNIKGTALSWFHSFLTGRSQTVTINHVLSDILCVIFGVPQGSVLGPVLFNIYCSSIVKVFSSCGFSILNYADDNTGYISFSCSSELHVFNQLLPSLLEKLKSWMHSHFLKLNESKTQIMVFGRPRTLSSIQTQSFKLSNTNDKLIELSQKMKYLGVILDPHLSFDHHINFVTSQCYALLRNISNIRQFLDISSTESLVHAVITSRLDMCNSLFAGINKSLITKLQRVQNRASRIILLKGHHQGVPSSLRLQKLHWLNINQRITFKVLLITFKCAHDISPVYLSSLLEQNHSSSRYPNTLSLNLFTPRTAFGHRSFAYFAPRLWNALPLSLRSCECLNTFKKKLKTYLFTSYDDFTSKCNRYHHFW